MNGQGCIFLWPFHCLGDPAHGPSTWAGRFLPLSVDDREGLQWAGVGWDWWSSRHQGCAAATSLRPVVPGTGQEVVCGER